MLWRPGDPPIPTRPTTVEWYFGVYDGNMPHHVDTAPCVSVPPELANRVGEALNLTGWFEEVAWGGESPLEDFAARLARWPDGHPDPDVHRALAELLCVVGYGRRFRDVPPGCRRWIWWE
ncbi:hypothetical protein [Thermomonospora cellulosilytica]|uniref:Uncharacterized protein n=1 Tax=Thermomonospora cellulosilytica TaxID=1411118 RepID=A0A7W3N1R3_9ACTN|nr:hypothetical protein [Thermomonospora cellulosilytica]MBA9005961.1 hypothetical protein [Thermomonospora cellulosilytica]